MMCKELYTWGSGSVVNQKGSLYRARASAPDTCLPLSLPSPQGMVAPWSTSQREGLWDVLGVVNQQDHNHEPRGVSNWTLLLSFISSM